MNQQPVLKIAFDPIYAHPLPEGHRFPMLKYELIPEQLLYEGTITRNNLFAPLPCSEETILWTHDAGYLLKLKNQTLFDREQRRIGFPQSPALTMRELIITQGTIDCCHYAFKNGVSLNIAGGTHHAYADRGEGFCLLNDFAVAANCLLRRQLAGQILVIDLDVHQGNGTAHLFNNEKRVYTFSMHGKNNYPFHKEKSDWDIPLEDYTDDNTYLSLLQKALLQLFPTIQPDMVFYVSGVDILDTDKFGKLKISLSGCKRRDEIVFEMAKKYQVPCVAAMGGGYSADIKKIVEAHCNTFRVAKEIFQLT